MLPGPTLRMPRGLQVLLESLLGNDCYHGSFVPDLLDFLYWVCKRLSAFLRLKAVEVVSSILDCFVDFDVEYPPDLHLVPLLRHRLVLRFQHRQSFLHFIL